VAFAGTEYLRPHTLLDHVADPDTLVECIVGAAKRLDNSGVRPDVFGIQLIQLGEDEGTKSALLLDDFRNKYNVRVCGQLAYRLHHLILRFRKLRLPPRSTLPKAYSTPRL